jgi:hypothetical protein
VGRIRTIKPEFFKHSGLYEAEQETGLPMRVAFAGLWTCCDRDGRFKWRPCELKLDVLPYDDCDFSRVLDALMTRGFIVRYASGTDAFGYVPSWKEHQFVNHRERHSSIPNPANCQQVTTEDAQNNDASLTDGPRVDDASLTREARNLTRVVKEGKGKEGKDASFVSDDDGLEPSMVTTAVMDDLHLSGMKLRVVLDDVCNREMRAGMSADDLRTALVDAYREYEIAKPRLSYTCGAEKFFGELWRNKAGWPWKDGQAPATPKAAVVVETETPWDIAQRVKYGNNPPPDPFAEMRRATREAALNNLVN